MKNVGERIFGQARGMSAGIAPMETEASDALVKTVTALGIPVEHLSIQVTGDVATDSGRAKNQADREKMVLVVGNTQGIAQVEEYLLYQTLLGVWPLEPHTADEYAAFITRIQA